ncbi:GntR family transcriptional regulator [Oceanobacillus sp. Castelsardo]|uniref:GntR family transcriptional regulator n=1 Tax=Oceanobacillus sp. Castelsardo TaxID=1851204 RepID=UPI000837AFB5|nr:GntR family transcriptional regulator [Oceanobacillus sp. Castelsardo]
MKKYSVTAKSLKEQSYNVIKEAIIRGVLSDNEALTEKKAKELFGISRTPFREAIQRLEAEEWLISIPYKGTYVNPLTMQDVEDILQIRLIIEIAMAKKAAENITNEQIDILQNLMGKMKSVSSEQSDYEFTLIDQEFHKTINQFGNNKRLVSMSEHLYDLIRRIAMTVLKSPIRRKEVIEEHLKIIEGLRTNNVEKTLLHHYDRVRFEADKYFSSL